MYQSQLTPNDQDFSLVHYKNCIFHGQIVDSLKQNAGIILLDNGQVLIGKFKNDQLNGDCICFLNPQTYIIGSFTRGLLDGNFSLRNSKMTIYWTAKMNKIQGQIVVINYESMISRTWLIENGQGFCTKQININQMDKQEKILSKISPYTEPIGLSLEFLAQKFTETLKIETFSLTQTAQISLPNNSFIQIKVVLFKDRIIEYGVYNNGQLNGLGFQVQGSSILEGKFKDGKLDGNGLKIQSLQEKMMYGTFKNGDIRSLDIVSDKQQNSRRQLKSYKKKTHIHSLEYCNNYFNQRPVLMLQNLLNTIQSNQKNFTQQLQYQQDLSQRHEKTFQKTKDAWVSSGNGLTSSLKKQKSVQQVNQQNNESLNLSQEKYQSRFKTQNPNLMSDSSNRNDQFSEGIKQYNLINKALKKFK